MPPASKRTVVSSTLPVDLIWTLNLDSQVTQSPLVTEQWVVIVTDRSLYVFDVVTGELQWQHPNITNSHPIPMVVEGDSLIIGEFGGLVSSLDFSTGQLRWQKQINDDAHSFFNSIIIVDGLVVAVSQPTEIKALSLIDGSVQWEISSRTTQILDRAVHAFSYNDKVYISDIKTYIVDAASGNLGNVIALDTTQMQLADKYLFDQHSVYDPETLQYRFNLAAPNQNAQSKFCNGLLI